MDKFQGILKPQKIIITNNFDQNSFLSETFVRNGFSKSAPDGNTPWAVTVKKVIHFNPLNSWTRCGRPIATFTHYVATIAMFYFFSFPWILFPSKNRHAFKFGLFKT
jgi:hypothetical protein